MPMSTLTSNTVHPEAYWTCPTTTGGATLNIHVSDLADNDDVAVSELAHVVSDIANIDPEDASDVPMSIRTSDAVRLEVHWANTSPTIGGATFSIDMY
jgi:hypothetical protein